MSEENYSTAPRYLNSNNFEITNEESNHKKRKNKKFNKLYKKNKWDRDEMIQFYTLVALHKKFGDEINFSTLKKFLLPTRSSSQIYNRMTNSKNLDIICDIFWKELATKSNLAEIIYIVKNNQFEMIKNKMYEFMVKNDWEIIDQENKIKIDINKDRDKFTFYQFNTEDNKETFDLLNKSRILRKYKNIRVEISSDGYDLLNGISRISNLNFNENIENLHIDYTLLKNLFLKKFEEK